MTCILSGYSVKETTFVTGQKIENLYLHFVQTQDINPQYFKSCAGTSVFTGLYKGDFERILSDLLPGTLYDVKYFYNRDSKSYIVTEISIHVDDDDSE